MRLSSNLGLLCQEEGAPLEAMKEFDAALGIAREIGNVTLEYTVLCNLGIAAEAEGNVADAISHYDKAVAAATQSSDRRAEGQFRGYLAMAQAKLGLMDDSRNNLAVGEELLLDMSDQLSYALIMCQRAEIEIIAARRAEAATACSAAERIARELNAGAESELGRRLATLKQLLL